MGAVDVGIALTSFTPRPHPEHDQYLEEAPGQDEQAHTQEELQ